MLGSKIKILFAGNQGGVEESIQQAEINKHLNIKNKQIKSYFILWKLSEAQVFALKYPSYEILIYEKFFNKIKYCKKKEVDRINREYRSIAWGSLIAAERSITDTSFLIGAGGNAYLSQGMTEHHIICLVLFYENVLQKLRPDCIFGATADTLFTHIFIKIAQQKKIPFLSCHPVWIGHKNLPSFTIAEDEFTHNFDERLKYKKYLTKIPKNRIRYANKILQSIKKFDANKVVTQATGVPFLVGALSPNLRDLPQYIIKKLLLQKKCDYRKFSLKAKIFANLKRLWRRQTCKKYYGSKLRPKIAKYVLFPLHFQPEQSTLVGGVFYANQVALVENISKSLPLGWTLIVKEHPRGRGSRPLWQYKHLASFPNVLFNDAPTKELMNGASAVITITGTIALEAAVQGTPSICLGQTYFDHLDLIYKVQSFDDLRDLLRKILIHKTRFSAAKRKKHLSAYALSFYENHSPGLPHLKEQAPNVAQMIMKKVSKYA